MARDIPLGRAVLSVETDTKGYDAGLSKVEGSAKGLEKKFEDVGRAIGGLVSFDVLSGLASDAVAATSAVSDMADRLGETAEVTQELAFAASQTGASIGLVGTAIGTMSKKLESGSAEKALAAIGLEIGALQEMQPAEAFQAIGDAIGAIEDPMERSKAAMELFGASGTKLLPMMITGIGDLRQQARDTGAVLSNELVASGDRLGDTWDQVNTRLNNLKAEALLPVLGLFEQMPAQLQLVAGAGVGLAGNLKDIGLAIMAVGGPTAAIGMLTSALSSLGFLLTLPAGAVVAAIVGLVAVWRNWDRIGPIVSDVYDAVKTWLLDKMTVLFNGLKTALKTTIDAIALMLRVGGILLNPVAGVLAVWRNWDTIVDIAQRVYTGVKTWLVDKFAAIVQGVKDKIAAVTGFFNDMYETVVGHSIVPDMVDRIGEEFLRMGGLMTDRSQGAVGGVLRIFTDCFGGAGGGGLLSSILNTGLSALFGPAGPLMNLVNAGMQALGDLIAKGLRALGGAIRDFWDWAFGGGAGGSAPDFTPPPPGDGPGPDVPQMAHGGYGRVTRPTLFLAGEAGPEDFAFSGGNKRFGGGGAVDLTAILTIDGKAIGRAMERVFLNDVRNKTRLGLLTS